MEARKKFYENCDRDSAERMAVTSVLRGGLLTFYVPEARFWTAVAGSNVDEPTMQAQSTATPMALLKGVPHVSRIVFFRLKLLKIR